MGGMNFRDAYEFDPEAYGGEGGGLLGRLQAMIQQGQVQPGADSGSTPSGAPEYNPDSYGSQQSGLLGRLLALQAEQSRYQPGAGNGGQAPSVPQNPNFGQTPQTRITVRPFDAYSPYDSETYRGEGGLLARLRVLHAPVAEASGAQPQASQEYEADQAQQAREAAAARLVRGVRNLARAEASSPDSIDIAKSAGIGVINGAINTAGLIGDTLTGFGYFPAHLVENPIRRMAGYPDLPADTPGWVEWLRPDGLRHSIENYTGEFYQPRSRAGRYAETIGEMAPLILGGAAWGARRGGQAAAAALRDLPGTLVKHAVVPGIAVQGLEEAYPESQAGQSLQKAYPVIRHGLPVALAAKRRYLGRRVAP